MTKMYFFLQKTYIKRGRWEKVWEVGQKKHIDRILEISQIILSFMY